MASILLCRSTTSMTHRISTISTPSATNVSSTRRSRTYIQSMPTRSFPRSTRRSTADRTRTSRQCNHSASVWTTTQTSTGLCVVSRRATALTSSNRSMSSLSERFLLLSPTSALTTLRTRTTRSSSTTTPPRSAPTMP